MASSVHLTTFATMMMSEIQCSICMEQYDNEKKTPRILDKCSHTFCQKCLKDMIKKLWLEDFTCPEWKEPYPSITQAKSFKKNFAIITILQRFTNTISSLHKPAATPEDFQICVKQLSGTDFTMMVKSTDLVTKIKEKVYDLTGVPILMQRLAVGKREVKDIMTMAAAGIKSNMVVHVLHRLKGGLRYKACETQSSQGLVIVDMNQD